MFLYIKRKKNGQRDPYRSFYYSSIGPSVFLLYKLDTESTESMFFRTGHSFVLHYNYIILGC